MIATLENLWRNARALLVALTFLVMFPITVFAACSDIAKLGNKVPAGYDINLVQSGLRAALGDESGQLSDGRMGQYTRSALERLCNKVPRYGSVPDEIGTLDLAIEYGEMFKLMQLWAKETLAEGFLGTLIPEDNGAPTPEILRLAATPPMSVAVLIDTHVRPDCAGIVNLKLAETAKTAMNVLLRDKVATSLEEICMAFPVDGNLTDFADALAAIGALEEAQPGAIRTLRDPEFAKWINEKSASRMLALLGTNDAVLQLLDDYPQKEEPSVVVLPASCKAKDVQSTLTYMSFGQAQLDLLADPVDLSPVFEALAEKQFVSADLLWQALHDALEKVAGDCVLDQVQDLVMGPDNLGQIFELNAETVASFKLNPGLSTAEPLITPLVGITSPTREELLVGIKATLSKSLNAALAAEVELAAGTAAGAAEPVKDVLDEPRVDEAQFEKLVLPPQIGVTDAALIAVTDTIVNQTFKTALEEAPFLSGTNPDQIKANVRQLLRPLVADQITEAVNKDMVAIEDAIVTAWMLTPTLKEKIGVIAQSVSTVGDSTALDLPARMKSLVGVQYPIKRLFQAALNDVQSVNGASSNLPSLSDGLTARAIKLASQNVPAPNARRVTAPLASDCGCVPKRKDAGRRNDTGELEQSTNVYSFYPFWLAPIMPPKNGEAKPVEDVDPDTIKDAGNSPPEKEPAKGKAKGPELVDFELTSQLAFYGLEFSYDNPKTDDLGQRNLRLLHQEHWATAKRDFVNSAHRHRAKADLAFTLFDWSSWTPAEISLVVEQIDSQSLPFKRFEGASLLEASKGYLLTRFDTVQPDGVTLIFEDYTGDPKKDLNIGNLILLTQQVQRRLAKRGQSVNLAFGLNLMEVSDRSPLMDDLHKLLIAESDDTKKIVDKVLVFLERPTSNTKKRLRARFDRGGYRGEERPKVLRSIIPIVPPSGHQFVEQLPQKGQEPNPSADEYSQFTDDVAYFDDNFGGIGFWPVPLIGAPETAKIKEVISEKWNAKGPLQDAKIIREKLTAVCTFACPNRAYIILLAMAIFTVVALLIWRSFYSGTVDWIAFKLFGVWIGVAVIAVLLLLLTGCDHRAFWPPILLGLLAASLAAIAIFGMIQRARNGPKP